MKDVVYTPIIFQNLLDLVINTSKTKSQNKNIKTQVEMMEYRKDQTEGFINVENMMVVIRWSLGS